MSSGSGFPGGETEFYTGNGMGDRANTTQPSYRSQLSGIFPDPSSQIANWTSSLIGKRTLSEFQTHQQQNQQIGGLFLRSVKPRMYNHVSPISPLSQIEFSGGTANLLQQQRYGMALQQLRSQPTNLATVSYMNAVQNQVMAAQESEQKMMNRLHELEKQLLDDNDDDEGYAVSAITNSNSNSEWSEAIQNLMNPIQKPISPSPTSSSSSSSSVVSPASGCSKQSVMEAASAISEAKTEMANEIITRLGQVANAKGNSEQRLMDYMISALKSRINPVENPPPVTELYRKEHAVSTQMLYDLSPCFKLGFMAANLAIIDATLGNYQLTNIDKFHVIDFDIGQGGQYMNLIHGLSSRQNGKPTTLKITTVADSANGGEENLKTVGDILRRLAERVGITLQFNVVNQKLTELTRDSLGCEPDEPVAVNFAFKLHRMPDESVSTENPRDDLLRRVKGLSPRVVTLVEQEINTNTAPFMARVNESWSYFGALFDSIDSTVTRNYSDRVKVEEGLGRKLANSVACEGRDRIVRCEVFGKWRARMGMAGFELKPLSQNVAESMRARVNSGNRVNPGFTVKEEDGGVCFGWMGRTLTVASAWR